MEDELKFPKTWKQYREFLESFEVATSPEWLERFLESMPWVEECSAKVDHRAGDKPVACH